MEMSEGLNSSCENYRIWYRMVFHSCLIMTVVQGPMAPFSSSLYIIERIPSKKKKKKKKLRIPKPKPNTPKHAQTERYFKRKKAPSASAQSSLASYIDVAKQSNHSLHFIFLGGIIHNHQKSQVTTVTTVHPQS